MSRRIRSAPLALVPFALGAMGCAQNSLFELYVEVPPPVQIVGAPTMAEARFVRVLLLPGAVSSDQLWDGPRSRIAELESGTATSWIGLTVTRGIASESDPISVRIAYCETRADCEDNDPSAWLGHEDLVFDRVFYTGQRTCYSRPLTDTVLTDGLSLDPGAPVIDACEVAGCIGGDPGVDFCAEPGRPQTHFCALGRQGAFCDDMHDEHASRLLP